MHRIAVCAILLLSAPALAEPELGSRLERNRKAMSENYKETPEDAAKAVHAFSRCVADSRPKVAARILRLPLGSDEQALVVRATLGEKSSCLVGAGSLSFHSMFLIGGIAEELFFETYKSVDVRTVLDGRTQPPPASQIDDLASCLVYRNPIGVRSIIDAAPTTPLEATAIRNLVPDIGPCTPAGLTLALTKPMVRALAAAALYNAVASAVPR